MTEASGGEYKGLRLEGAGQAISRNMYIGIAFRSRRLDLAKAGYSIKASDINDPLIGFEGKAMDKLKGNYKNFKFPTITEVSDEQGQPDQEKLDTVRMALAAAPIIRRNVDGQEIPNIRDFRTTQTELQQSGSMRLVFADGDPEYSKTSYDPEKLLIALAADLQAPEDDYTIVSYPHLNLDRTIQGVTVLIMTKIQRSKLRVKLLSNPNISTKSEAKRKKQ